MNATAFANYLHDQLQERGWEQKDLAARSGIRKATISRLLNGLVENPELPTLIAIAGALEVSLPYLLERAGYEVEPINDPEEASRRIAREIDAFPWLKPVHQWLLDLDPDERSGVIAYLESIRRQRSQDGDER